MRSRRMRALSPQQTKARAAQTDWAIFATVLRDKEGYDADGLARVFAEAEALAESIAGGYVNVQDLLRVLERETAAEAGEAA